MTQPDVDYHFPETVDQAIRLKQQAGKLGHFVAGGTDLMIFIEQQALQPTALIDLTRIPALQQLKVDNGRVSIGGTVTYQQFLSHRELCESVPFLEKAVRTIGGVQVRNVATVVGNIANASPAGDTLPCLYVLQTVVHTTGPEGVRHIPIHDFIQGVRHIDLLPAELITHITFKLPGAQWIGSFEKLGLRQAMAIAVASAAVLLAFDGPRITDARIALGSVSPTPVFAPEAEDILLGNTLSTEHREEAAKLAQNAAHPIDDVRSSARYRKLVIGGLVRRALAACQSQTPNTLE